MPTLKNSDELEAVRASHEFTASRWLTCATSNHTVNNGVSGACTSEASGAACAHRARLIHRAAGSERTSTRARPRVSARDCVDAIDTHAMGVVRCAPPSSARGHALIPVPSPPRNAGFRYQRARAGQGTSRLELARLASAVTARFRPRRRASRRGRRVFSQ